jgi:hypothetical protein
MSVAHSPGSEVGVSAPEPAQKNVTTTLFFILLFGL